MRTRILGIVLTLVLATSCLFSDCTLMSVEAATDVCITVDGELSDWDYIKKMYTGEGRMLQVAAFRTDDSIYVMRELNDMSLYNGEQMFFNTDGDNTSGYNGGEWMLQGTSLYQYTGATPNQWSWNQITGASVTLKASEDSVSAEYKLAISDFTDFNAESFGVNVCPTDTNWGTFASFPAGASDYALIPAYNDVYQESDSVPIESVTLNLTGGSLQAITDATMPGGVAGTFSTVGGDGANYTYSLATSATYGIDNSKFSISGDQLIVGDTMLSPGSYSIYVSVKSDIRSAKVPVTFLVGSASASAEISESVFAGQNGQWFAVNHNAANSIPTLKALKAATDGKNLYAFVDATTLSHNAAFYIATPDTTGANIDTWADSSNVKYKVDMTGTLYEYNGDWQSVGTVTILKTDVGAEISVPLSMIGNIGEQKTIRVGVKDGETCYLPNKGMSMYTVITPLLTTMPTITADGDPSDWTGLQPIAKGSGTVGDVYAIHDDNYLYVMTTLSGVDQADWDATWALSSNLLINGDGDSTTGLQHTEYPAGSGADFLVQDWYSVGTEKQNIEFFYGQEAGSLGAAKSGGHDWKKFAKVDDNGNYCIEYAVPIAKMKEQTSTVSDDMYIAVTRQADGYPTQQSGFTDVGKMVSETYVFVPKYNTTVPVSAEDGAFGDWNKIARTASNTSTESTCNLYATRSDQRLYTLVTNEKGGLNTVNTYYISTGDNTGYSISGYEKIDYIVKDAKLFQVVADNTLSEALDDVWMSYYNDNIEMQLYLSQIGNPETIKIVWRGASGSLQIPADDEMLNVTATFEMKRDAGYYYPVEDFAAFTNPYKGWAIWGLPDETINDWDNDYYYFDSNLIYIGLTWKDLQPNSEDEFLLEEFLDKYNIREWVARGKRINLRFMMDNTDWMGVSDADWAKGEDYVKNLVETKLKWERMDIPMWLYEELVEYDKANGGDGSGAGIFYWDPDGVTLGIGYDQGGFAPNYYSPKLLERHEEIIQKMAAYFDNNQITGHVMVGSLGHWGEFHVWPEYSGIWPTVDILDKYTEHYTKAFKNVKLGIRKPYPHAAANGYGLFNDIFGSDVEWGIQGTQSFYSFFMNGNTDMGGATDTSGHIINSGGTAEQIEASKMPDFWKTSWSGGEFANGQIRVHVTNDTSKDGTRGIMGCLDETRYCHVSWMGPCSPSNFYKGEIDAALYDANVNAMLKLMGYNFALEKINQLTEIKKGEATEITMVWNNQGVAPFYYNWPLEFSLIDHYQGEVAYRTVVDGNITSWLPGRHEVKVAINVPGNIHSGNYTLAVAILDKDSLEPAMKLAIDGGREDLRYPLYDVDITGANTNTGGSTSGSTTESTTETGKTQTSGKGSVVADEDGMIKYSQLKRALSKAKAGDSFLVDMDGETVVSASILKSIRKKEVEVTFIFDNGVIWNIKGEDIGDGKLKDIDFLVTLHTDNILKEIVDAILGDNDGFQFNIKHKGEFGLKARLTLPVGKEHRGRIAELYYFNEETGALELAGSDTVTVDGTASYDFTHASDYLIVLSGDVAEDVTEEGVVEDGTGADTGVVTPEDGAEAPAEDNTTADAPAQTGGNSSLWIIIAIIAIAVIVAGVLVYRFVFAQKGENGDE